MAKDLTSNKLEWAVTQAFGGCPHCQMDLSLLGPAPSPQVTGRISSERRGPRTNPIEMVDLYVSVCISLPDGRNEVNAADRAALASLASARLEPFRMTDLSTGIYADNDDSLGRVWYHIPNLGPKYNLVVNLREASVIARKKSKESECMWLGIVGDPADYTTGSKRHIIEFMLRNPGITLEHSLNRRNSARVRINKNLNPLKKRRRKRRRPTFQAVKSDASGASSDSGKQQIDGSSGHIDAFSGSSFSDSESENISSESSITPSMISVERQTSGQFGFGFRDTTGSPPPPVSVAIQNANDSRQSQLALPPASSTLSVDQVGDWFDSINKGAYTFVLREPHLTSPEAAKQFSLSRSVQPPSPEIKVVRKYSIEDLNQLLAESDVI